MDLEPDSGWCPPLHQPSPAPGTTPGPPRELRDSSQPSLMRQTLLQDPKTQRLHQDPLHTSRVLFPHQNQHNSEISSSLNHSAAATLFFPGRWDVIRDPHAPFSNTILGTAVPREAREDPDSPKPDRLLIHTATPQKLEEQENAPRNWGPETRRHLICKRCYS